MIPISKLWRFANLEGLYLNHGTVSCMTPLELLTNLEPVVLRITSIQDDSGKGVSHGMILHELSTFHPLSVIFLSEIRWKIEFHFFLEMRKVMGFLRALLTQTLYLCSITTSLMPFSQSTTENYKSEK